jgi:hypothetical protein
MIPPSHDFQPIHPCPKPGLCLDLLGRLDGTDRDILRHDREIKEMRDVLITMQKDVHTLVSQAAGRDRMTHAVLGIFGALLVAGLAQFGATVWWGARLQATTESIASVVSDHAKEIRIHGGLLGTSPRYHTP